MSNLAKEMAAGRCRYDDCISGFPVADENEQVTCPNCRHDLGLPPLAPKDDAAKDDAPSPRRCPCRTDGGPCTPFRATDRACEYCERII